jgi:hypothetical protein
MNQHFFPVRTVCLGAVTVIAVVAASLIAPAAEWNSGKVYPEPLVVDPGPIGGPPSDAIVLFDGKDMSAWDGADDWQVKDGVVTVNPKSPEKGAGATTKQSFGDCQLHVEWAEPDVVKGSGQGRGNSGVFLMNRYEVQVLDSYNNKTYFDGQCGAIYKQTPPLVNCCRKPGEWQTYDIIFRAPRVDENSAMKEPGYITVLQNGVLIQNHTEILGSTSWDHPSAYEATLPEKAPLQLQNHGNPVRYRNIWIRELTPQTYTMPEKPATE